MTTIYFVRHAQPDFTVHDDATRPLSNQGKEDCQKLIAFFHQIPIDLMFSSPFKRAYDTIWPLAQSRNTIITTIDDLRERKVSDTWLTDFPTFAYRQWQDFSFKLEHGESLAEVQSRSIRVMSTLLTDYSEKTLLIGTHGTALSTIINYYDQKFGFAEFNAIKAMMPWIVKMSFDGNHCVNIESFTLNRNQAFTTYAIFD
ncbi:histidine phosphatase family protein [Vagococcus sp. BWB3-3]|uniref:Histidine phosphatase family protein n=1 Tax=Vagococcus allomyrinae TaxID=2794353 RepID=A0A940PC07_9ENTE|nr:histidine phosphatase family protein [Vagococcus allomyrinae]MBP1040701.1 histidine phosphatase family protein [Vagococcus allomyrinae]